MPAVSVTAPVRIFDCGGWSDTWFAGHGAVLHVAVTPGVTVRIDATPAGEASASVTMRLASYGDEYGYRRDRAPGRHPLIEAAVDEWCDRDLDLSIVVESLMPPGASTGTSAALIVAIAAACASLGGEVVPPQELARRAHQLETERLGLQAGVQDHIAAAFGGVNFIEMTSYPSTRVSHLSLDPAVATAIARDTRLFYLGRAHRSSSVHDDVIKSLGARGAASQAFDELRAAAVDARDALVQSDLRAFGRALIRNTDAQTLLHPSLVGEAARAVLAIATRHGALGWKVNGAGGEGGTVALLLDETTSDVARRLTSEVESRVPGARLIDIQLAADGAVAQRSGGRTNFR